jgi:hypothetical protein
VVSLLEPDLICNALRLETRNRLRRYVRDSLNFGCLLMRNGQVNDTAGASKAKVPLPRDRDLIKQ